MSEDLERILAQFLKVNRYECCYSIYKDENEEKQRRAKYVEQHTKDNDWDLGCLVEHMCARFHFKQNDEQATEYGLNKLKDEIDTLDNKLKEEKENSEIEEELKNKKQTLKDVTAVIEKNKSEPDPDWQKKQRIFPIIWKKFNEFREKPNIIQRVKFDKISSHLKRFFMEESKDEKDVKSGSAKWVPTFD
eukprot:18385_1